MLQKDCTLKSGITHFNALVSTLTADISNNLYHTGGNKESDLFIYYL